MLSNVNHAIYRVCGPGSGGGFLPNGTLHFPWHRVRVRVRVRFLVHEQEETDGRGNHQGPAVESEVRALYQGIGDT